MELKTVYILFLVVLLVILIVVYIRQIQQTKSGEGWWRGRWGWRGPGWGWRGRYWAPVYASPAPYYNSAKSECQIHCDNVYITDGKVTNEDKYNACMEACSSI